MSRYRTAREMGSSHEHAVLFDARDIVDEEITSPRDEFEPAERDTVLANARQDISAIAMLLAGISARQRRMEWLLLVAVGLLGVVAIR